MVGERTHRVEPHIGAVRDEDAPVRTIRIRDGRGDQREVLCAVGVRDDQEPVAERGMVMVLDRVLVSVLARRDDPRTRLGCVGRHEPRLRGELRRRLDQHESSRTGAADVEEEAFVVLAEHEVVIAGRRAEPVPPDLVGTQRRVGPHVEARTFVVGPGQPVGHVVDDVGEVGASLEVAEVQRVPLTAGDVGGVGEQPVVGRDLEAAQ